MTPPQFLCFGVIGSMVSLEAGSGGTSGQCSWSHLLNHVAPVVLARDGEAVAMWLFSRGCEINRAAGLGWSSPRGL